MYPEKSFLTQKVRRLIMAFWFLLFFILAPAVLLYTAGYGYDWQNNRLTRTGVISIDIEPEDATVEVNGVVMTDRMPLRLANRRPGSYHIKIYKDEYKTWERDVALFSGETTYVRNMAAGKFEDNSLSKRSIKQTEVTTNSPTDYLLNPNYPNPFNPTTNINFSLPQMSIVTLNIYNIRGQLVKTLINENKLAGDYTVSWNGRNDSNEPMPSGIYFCRIQTNNFIKTIKMTLLK